MLINYNMNLTILQELEHSAMNYVMNHTTLSFVIDQNGQRVLAYPLDSDATPQDIAPVVAFLLSDMTPWIRGTNIPVDGGQFSNVLCNMNGL